MGALLGLPSVGAVREVGEDREGKRDVIPSQQSLNQLHRELGSHVALQCCPMESEATPAFTGCGLS